MVNLIEGVKVVEYNSDTSSSKTRIWINSGTHRVTPNNCNRNIFIPIEDWSEASCSDRMILCNESSENFRNISSQIGILCLPNLVISPLEALGVNFATNAQDCDWLYKQSDYQQAVSTVVEYVQTFSEANDNLLVHRLNVNPPSLRTVTHDPVNNFYIGLHLDSWDKDPVERRHLSNNRICINLGLEDRYFLFINLTLIEMFFLITTNRWDELLNIRYEDKQEILLKYYSDYLLTHPQIHPDDIRQNFLQKYPEYPVIKLRVAPDEAYIAPTENIIHDGCTFGKKFFDVSLTIRGKIQMPK